MSLSPEFLDELRVRTGLAAVVGRRVKLTRAGREWKGCCPFHNEKTPSFYVNEDKGFYHCFGCGAHGDAIRFLVEQEGLGFMDAVRQLASEAGLEMPRQTPRTPEAEKRAGLHGLLAAAAEFFTRQLESTRGADARAYLGRRGVSPALAAEFGLGFAPDARHALSQTLRDAFPASNDAMLRDAGLTGVTDSGDSYDRFRARLMFPIHDSRGRVVGFGGRALGDIEPKYLNSAEGPVFAKGRLLYNLHRAAPAARKSGQLLVVEGYMDVIGLARAGMINAVAPLGTALTEEQMEMAWRLVDEPVLAFDGDPAGMRAAVRAGTRALPLLRPGKSLAFLTLPRGQDPDDVARNGGKAAIDALAARAQPLEPFLFGAETAGAVTDTPERRAALRRHLLDLAGTILDENLRRDYQRSWARRLNERFAPARATAFTRGRTWRDPPAPPLRQETRASETADNRILAMLLASFAARPDAVPRHAESLAALPVQVPPLARLRDGLLDGHVPDGLPPGLRPLWPHSLADAEFDRRASDALASLIELHHIATEMELPPGVYADDEQLAREHRRRSLLGAARAKAYERLVAHAIGGDAV